MRAAKLGEALADAGIHPRDVEFDIAIAKYLNSGGTIEGALARLNAAAARMPGMGQAASAYECHLTDAQTRQQVEDGGAIPVEPQGQSAVALSSSSTPDREGHIRGANLGHLPAAQPVREPSRTERGLSSIKLVQSTIQKGLLELRKTSDGRSWGAVGWHELDGMDRDGAIARLIKSGVNPPKNQHAELRSFLSNKQFEEICNAAKKQNDFV
jgi:hypothetical protein